MSKLKFCLLVFMVAIFVGVTATVASVAFAVDVDKYIEADITLTSDSLYGAAAVAQVSYWESDDKVNWVSADTFQNNWCDIVYYNADDNSPIGLTAPTQIGKYIARVVVNGTYNKNNYFMGSTKLTKDLVLASYPYQIVYEDFAVVFAPNCTVDYDSEVDSYQTAINGTKVYYKGNLLVKDVDYSIVLKCERDGDYVVVTEAINPGTYKIEVTLNSTYVNANISEENKVFSSTFNIVNSIANLIKLDSQKKYEGMYQNDASEAADYYAIAYSGRIKTAEFDGKYDINYIKDNQVLAECPQTAGEYVVRFTFNQNIDVYDISLGDFIDLKYTIYQKPYVVSFENNGVSIDGGYSIIEQDHSIIITPVFEKNLKVVKTVKYFKATSDSSFVQLTYGEFPKTVGKYKVEFQIDVSEGNITGAAMFGDANKDYVITDKNNVLTYEFQIVPRMSVTFNSDFSTAGTEYASILKYTGFTPNAVKSIQDVTQADIPTDIYTVAYFDENWNTTEATKPGVYTGVITFNIDNSEGVWTNGQTVIANGTKYYFNLKVCKVQSNIKAKKFNNGIILNFGTIEVEPSAYSTRYFKFENNINYSCLQQDLVNTVGNYHIVLTFNCDYLSLGIAENDIIILDYVNESEGSLSNVILSVNNIVDSGNGLTIKYSENIVPINVNFQGVSPELISTLNYSFYYQILDRNADKSLEGSWSVCATPKMPGTYRGVFVVNEPNLYFNANTGDCITYEFTITPLELVPSFSVQVNEYTKDLVYDNNPHGKNFDVTFTSGGRPVQINSNLYNLRYSTKEVDGYSVFKTENPINAGDYIIAVYFKYSNSHILDKYGIYCDDPTILDPNDYTVANMSSRSVFSKTVSIQKMALTLVVGIPVEEKGMYRLDGTEVVPQYTFYKTNGYSAFNNCEEFNNLLAEKGDLPLDYINIDSFDSQLLTGNINSITCDNIVEDGKALNTGRYINNFTLKDDSKSNIFVDKILYSYDGAKENVTYNSQIYYASKKGEYGFTVEYRISPLPLLINSISLESIEENAFAEHYFGNTKPVSKSGLTFSTVDQFGNKYDLRSQNPTLVSKLASYVQIRYYNRLTGSSSIESTPIQIDDGFGGLTFDLASVDDYIFNPGDYSLRITFNEQQKPEYEFFTLVNGKNEYGAFLNGNEIEGNAYTDIEFTVKRANNLRVVFDRTFNSFVDDGVEKVFDIKFMSGNEFVTIPYTLVMIEIKNGVEKILPGSSFPDKAGDYALQVRFENDDYRYKIVQGENAGSYSENSDYILNQSYVKYYYSITSPIYLAWDFIQNGKTVQSLNGNEYDVSGEKKVMTVRFYDENNPAKIVNLIPNIDYAIWYYEVSNNAGLQYKKMLSAPSTTGKYIVELVFLRTLYDYKVVDHGIPYSYLEADEGMFGVSLSNSPDSSIYLILFNEKRYVEFDIVPSDLSVSGVVAADKIFDNTTDCNVSGRWAFTITDDGKLISEIENMFREILANKVVAKFVSVGVGESFVDLYLQIYKDSDCEILIQLPSERYLSEQTSYEYIANQINEIKNGDAYKNESVKSIIDTFESKINVICANYNISFVDVKANILKHTVVITPNAFVRDFDPFYRDVSNLTFKYDDALLDSFAEFGSLFDGNLSRDGIDESNVVGSYKILLGTLKIADTTVTLSNGVSAALNDCFQVKLDNRNSAYYTITKRAITVAIVSGLTKYYDEDDPEFVCEVVSGTLISGDRLMSSGDYKPTRATQKDRDDVGVYAVDMSTIAIFDSQGTDITSNYRISYVKAEFTIISKEISIIPTPTTNATYTDNFYELYNINAEQKRYQVLYDYNGIPKEYKFNEGYKLVGNFGLEQVVNTKPLVSAMYRITLGNLIIVNEQGKDVSSNYIIKTSNDIYYTVIKMNIQLEIVDQVTAKTFSSKDPIIRVKPSSDSKIPDGYSLREDSSASREQGENVGIYKILTNKVDNIYIVDDNTGEVVTKYFNILIKNKTSEKYPDGAVFEILKYDLFVTVKEETVIKGHSTIIAEFLFKDSDGRTVPQSILDKLTTSFDPPFITTPIEGINVVNVEFAEEDPNFEIHTEPGVINVIFPENNVTVKVIDSAEQVVDTNAFIVTNMMLLENKQMFLATTDNGQNPTKYIEVVLPVNEDLINKKLYVVAVRSDGSYELLDANVSNGVVIVSDNQFNYIMLCQLKVWPYYVAGAVVLLILIGLGAFLFAKLRRRKKRGGEKAVNYRKRAKMAQKSSEGMEQKGYKPTDSNEDQQDEFGDLDQVTQPSANNNAQTSSENVEVQTNQNENEQQVAKPESKKKKKEKQKGENSEKPTLSNVVPGGGVKPSNGNVSAQSIAPNVTPNNNQDDDVIQVNTAFGLDDELIIPTSTMGASEDILKTDSTNASNPDQSDEIVISTTRRLRGDDD